MRFFQFILVLVITSIISETSVAQDKIPPQDNIPVWAKQLKRYDVKSYDATISLDSKNKNISGFVEMAANQMGRASLMEIRQHAKFLTIDSVFVDGVRADYTMPDSMGEYKVIGFTGIPTGAYFILKTYYHGKFTNEGGARAWGGIQDTGGMIFAMGVGFSAPYVSCTRHWMPCYDEPDDKPDSVTLNFIVDTSGIVVSNGLQTGYLAGMEGGKKNYFQWKISHPIATYLLTFAFGKFEKLSIANPLHIPFYVYSFPKDTAQLRMLMEKRVVPALVFFDSLFGAYPFEKVGYVVAPIGSMEHQSMITLVNSALDINSTVAIHELAHQWWGDLTTSDNFDEVWLNEGFATFCESLYQERFSGKAQYWSNLHGHIASALMPSEDTIPLFEASSYTNPPNNYPPVIYNKGAAVLGMLRYTLGDAAFFTGLRYYSDATAYNSARSEDMQDLFQDTLKKDLRMFFTEWVYGVGHPEMNVLWAKKGDTVNMLFEQTQDSARIGFFRQPLVVETRTYSGKSERHEVLLDSLRFSEVTFINSFAPDTIIVDPDGAIIKKMNGAAKPGKWKTHILPSSVFDLKFTPDSSGDKNMKVSYNIKKIYAVANQAFLKVTDANDAVVAIIDLGFPQVDAKSENLEYFFNTGSLESGTYFASLVLNDQITLKGKLVVTK